MLVLAVSLLFGVLSAPAFGAFHLMKIREISGSDLGATNDAYVQLQMTASGQSQVAGHTLTVYDEDGIGGPAAPYTFTFPGNVQSSDNQRTILVGDTNVSGRDFTWEILSTAIGAGNFRGAGALCFPDASPPDCVSWGGFTGATLLPDGATPIPGPLPITSAFRRSISPGCPTLLEASDDTNNGAADFTTTAREPRGNSVTPTEKLCDSTGPIQTLTAKRRQDVDKAAVKLRLDEAGTVTLKGRVKVPNNPRVARSLALGRALKTKKSTRSLIANKKTKIKVKLTRKAKRKVKAAIEESGPRKITVTATAKDALGNPSTKKVRFKLTD